MADFSPHLQSWLDTLLKDAGGVAGTVHLHEQGGLRLAAAVNIPSKVRDVVAWVPSGKGMAGLALERGVPVQTCNLQEDRSGAVKPGAKAVDPLAAVSFPVRDQNGGIIVVVEAAFADHLEIAGGNLDRLHLASKSLAKLT